MKMAYDKPKYFTSRSSLITTHTGHLRFKHIPHSTLSGNFLLRLLLTYFPEEEFRKTNSPLNPQDNYYGKRRRIENGLFGACFPGPPPDGSRSHQLILAPRRQCPSDSLSERVAKSNVLQFHAVPNRFGTRYGGGGSPYQCGGRL